MLPHESLNDELAQAEAETAASIEYIRSLGIEPPEILLDKSEWLTAKRYANEHDMSVEEVEDWVERGVIPADCTMVLPEIHNIRLVKNRTYE